MLYTISYCVISLPALPHILPSYTCSLKVGNRQLKGRYRAGLRQLLIGSLVLGLEQDVCFDHPSNGSRTHGPSWTLRDRRYLLQKSPKEWSLSKKKEVFGPFLYVGNFGAHCRGPGGSQGQAILLGTAAVLLPLMYAFARRDGSLETTQSFQ